jgi:transmembrane sensor
MALTVAVLMVWIGAGDFLFHSNNVETYKTLVGKRKQVTLSDGSTVMLDTATEISVDFSEGRRWVVLNRGRALFSVIHDPIRPFAVTAGKTQVRVLGTEFDVHRTQTGDVVVAVVKGSVYVGRTVEANEPLTDNAIQPPPKLQEPQVLASLSVQSESKTFQPQKILIQGQKVVVKDIVPQIEVQEADIKSINSWREGTIDFTRASLEDVVTEVNRYLRHKIKIGDDRLKEIRINMIFKIDDSQHFLYTLVKTLPITYTTLPAGDVVLRKLDG